MSWFAQKREIPALKEVAPYPSEVPAHCLQAALKDLDTAYKNFFEHGFGYPQYRSKYENDSFRFPDPKQIRVDTKRGWLKLPKFGFPKRDWGQIRCVFHRKIQGKLRSVTITRDGNHWYASILCQVKDNAQIDDAPLTQDQVLAGDLGVAIPLMTSEGEAFGHAIEAAPPSGRGRRRRRLEQQLPRCKHGSKRRMRAKQRLAAYRARERRQRKDMIEKMSTEIAANCRVFVMEDLRVRAMTASASGTVEEPGRNVAAKAGLNRVILDKGWGMFRTRLGQKLARKGGYVFRVSAAYTSQRCNACGHVDKESRVTRERFACASCGHEAHADHNAALNILHRGPTQLGLVDPDNPTAGTVVAARGASGISRATKRELSEVSGGCLAA